MSTTITPDLADLAVGTRAWRTHGPTPDRNGTARPLGAPNYVARRIWFALALVIVATVLITAVAVPAASLAGFGGAPAVASGAQPASSAAAIHVAVPGDTLWSIAAEHRGPVGHADYLWALIDLNGGTTIQAGQAVRLP